MKLIKVQKQAKNSKLRIEFLENKLRTESEENELLDLYD